MTPEIETRIREAAEELDANDPYALMVPGVIVEAGTVLEYVVGRSAGRIAMAALFEAAVGRPASAGWEDDWRGLSQDERQRLDVVRFFHACHEYAYFGIQKLDDGQWGADSLSPIGMCTFLEEFEDHVRPEPESGPGQLIAALGGAVRARRAVDGDAAHTDVAPEELAALARVSLKSIRNLIAPSSGSGIRAAKNGRIPAADARRWLEGRPDFKRSVDVEVADLPQASRAMLDEALFIPVAKDGSVFTPDLARNGHFTIGPKGEERQVAGYREALAVLQRMERPCWRRPGGSGFWGIVAAQSWERRDARALGLGAGDA